jgi:hypothetical protein
MTQAWPLLIQEDGIFKIYFSWTKLIPNNCINSFVDKVASSETWQTPEDYMFSTLITNKDFRYLKERFLKING